MNREDLLNINKQLKKFNHLHIISENKPIPFKEHKDLWMKIWSFRKSKGSLRYN